MFNLKIHVCNILHILFFILGIRAVVIICTVHTFYSVTNLKRLIKYNIPKLMVCHVVQYNIVFLYPCVILYNVVLGHATWCLIVLYPSIKWGNLKSVSVCLWASVSLCLCWVVLYNKCTLTDVLLIIFSLDQKGSKLRLWWTPGGSVQLQKFLLGKLRGPRPLRSLWTCTFGDLPPQNRPLKTPCPPLSRAVWEVSSAWCFPNSFVLCETFHPTTAFPLMK